MRFGTTELLILLVVVIRIVLPVILLGIVAYSLLKMAKNQKYNKKHSNTIKSISERLKEIRIQHGYSQEYVATKLSVSRQAVSKWENGTSEPSTSNLLLLADLYGVSVDELLGRVR